MLPSKSKIDHRVVLKDEMVFTLWNRLPSEVLDAPSLSMFKRNLNNALKNML